MENAVLALRRFALIARSLLPTAYFFSRCLLPTPYCLLLHTLPRIRLNSWDNS